MNRLIAFFVEKRVFVDLLTVGTIFIGLTSFLLIRREVFPNVAFDIITVATISPGASAEEVEKLVTNPLEQDLKEVDGIKKMQSKSLDGRSLIVLQLDPDQTTEAEGKADIQDVVDRFELPSVAEQPTVTSLNSDQTPIIEVSVSGDLPELELREAARALEKRIEDLPGIARVAPRGMRDKEVKVEADPKKLQRYRVSLEELIQALKNQNVTISAGTVEVAPGTLDKERLVRTIGEFTTLADVENTVIRANETAFAIRVRDVAKVFYNQERATTLERVDGVPSISLVVLKKAKSDAIDAVDSVIHLIDEIRASVDQRVKIKYVNDFSAFIRRRLSVLGGNLAVGLTLVIFLLSLILERRTAILVATGIPFAFLATIIAFHNGSQSLNLVSLIGLIIVSGMLVDDAIVVMDNASRLVDEGLTPREAAIRGTQEIWPAVTASVLTTVVAFVPMLFMSGIFGKFVKEIPMGVIYALVFSLLEAFFILPAHFAHWIKPRKAGNREEAPVHKRKVLQRFENVWDGKFVPFYTRILERFVRHRYWVGFGMLFLFAFSIFLAVKVLHFVLFPSDGAEVFFVKVDAPNGYSLQQTAEVVKPVEAVIASLPKNELKNFVTTIGIQQQKPNDPNTRRGTQFAQLAVYISPPEDRSRTVNEIMDALREPISKVQGAKIVFEEVASGPPVGKAVSLSVRAREYSDILAAVESLKQKLSQLPGVKDISDSYVMGKEEIILRVNGAEAAAANLSVASIGTSVRAAFEGIEATTIRGLDEEIKVRASLTGEARKDDATLSQIFVPNPAGNLIPLTRVARFDKGQNLAIYEHEANEREVKVSADVDINVTTARLANNAVREFLPEFQKAHPTVKVAFGGEDEDTQESMVSLGRAFIVAFFAIFLILVFTFHNLVQPLLIMLTIPIGIISVVWTFLLHGRPLGFMAMLGMIALGGVIVNNAIVFIDFVNRLRAEGKDRFDSIVSAGKVRIRPIFLTTATTVAGLLPTAYGVGGRDDFVVPIALALGWGLAFGSALTAFVFPSAIAIADDMSLLYAQVVKKNR